MISPRQEGETRCALAIESLRVERDRVRARVRVNDLAHVMTTPQIAQAALALRPSLARHACVNGQGPMFGSVIGHTPLPHLLEHVVLDLQVEMTDDASRVFTGATRWIDEAAGVAEVEMSYMDDLVALRAFRDAAHMITRMINEHALSSRGFLGNGETVAEASRPRPPRMTRYNEVSK